MPPSRRCHLALLAGWAASTTPSPGPVLGAVVDVAVVLACVSLVARGRDGPWVMHSLWERVEVDLSVIGGEGCCGDLRVPADALIDLASERGIGDARTRVVNGAYAGVC